MKHDRVGGPLIGLAVVVIIFASAVTYVCAFPRVFEAPRLSTSETSAVLVEEPSGDVRVEVPRAATPEQALGHTAPAWLLNALPGYSSGRAREAWYRSLVRSDDRAGFEFVANSNLPASYGYIGARYDGFNARLFLNTPSFANPKMFTPSATPKTLSGSPLGALTT